MQGKRLRLDPRALRSLFPAGCTRPSVQRTFGNRVPLLPLCSRSQRQGGIPLRHRLNRHLAHVHRRGNSYRDTFVTVTHLARNQSACQCVLRRSSFIVIAPLLGLAVRSQNVYLYDVTHDVMRYSPVIALYRAHPQRACRLCRSVFPHPARQARPRSQPPWPS